MITKSIERAQKKVEENNFGIRKRLLEYDDVMNKQRTTIYRKRNNALFGDRLAIDISDMFYDVCVKLVEDNYVNKDYDYFSAQVISIFGTESPFTFDQFTQERHKY
jgi:preprotein translocase subunit SecA